MKFEHVADLLRGIPHMSEAQGKEIYDWICLHKPVQCLELGFAHGVSSCYIAAALEENGAGHLTTMDLTAARDLSPNVHELLELTDLQTYVSPIFAATSYVWELMKIIEARISDNVCTPLYDFCYVDGAHTWAVDGFAFFLVAKLLRRKGWILFDDMWWTFETSPALAAREATLKLAEDERRTPQIERVFTLLVRRHPDFGNFRLDGSWAWAQKINDESATFDAEAVREIAMHAACAAYLNYQFERGKRELSQSLRANAYLLEPSTWIVDQLVNFALQQSLLQQDAFLRQVFENLPNSADTLQRLERVAFSRLRVAEAFSSYATGDLKATRRAVLQGVGCDPSWLGNVGVLSILGESFIGTKMMNKLRELARNLRPFRKSVASISDEQ